MARWLVTQGDRQFSASDLAELKELAKSGKVGPGDMVQPPGATDWLYASELPELKGLLRRSAASYEDVQPESGSGATYAIMGILAVLIVIAAGVFYHYATTIPGKDDLVLLMQEEATGLPPESIREQEGWRSRL